MLKNIRKQIDSIDNKVVELLNERAALSKKIGDLKKKINRSIYAPDREKEVLTHIKMKNKGPLSNESLLAVYREIMSGSFTLEKPLSIAYLGPQASFTNLAAIHKFGSSVSYNACESITEVFLDVERDNSDYGVVPIENSIEGAINHTLDMFMNSDLNICAEIVLDISHNLLSNAASLCAIKKVYSNPMVFGQCRIWLQVNLPKAELIEVSSTTRATQIAAREKNSASIASTLASKVYGLAYPGKRDRRQSAQCYALLGNRED